MKPSHSPETERRIREAALDETLSATFPASDPLSTLPNPEDDSVGAAVSDRGDETGKLDPVAGCEFVDDRIRLPE
jgi:hypothetical protein